MNKSRHVMTKIQLATYHPQDFERIDAMNKIIQSQAADDFISDLLDQQDKMHKRASRVIDKKDQMIKQQARLIVWLVKQLQAEKKGKIK